MLDRYVNSCKVIYNHNRMWKSYLYPEKDLVMQSGYFILVTTVLLVMGIAYAKLLSYHGISEQSMDKKFSMKWYNSRTVYD